MAGQLLMRIRVTTCRDRASTGYLQDVLPTPARWVANPRGLGPRPPRHHAGSLFPPGMVSGVHRF